MHTWRAKARSDGPDAHAYENRAINGEPVQTQGLNIRRYSEYLSERVRGYRDTKIDHVREGAGRLKRLTVDKGLLRETETVQSQIQALLKCDVRSRDAWRRPGD
jgi:hypothetical protein